MYGESPPTAPALNNLNDGGFTLDQTPTFDFNLSDPDAGQNVFYDLQVDEKVPGDFTTPVLNLSEPRQNIKTIATGAYHTVALKTDGTVWAWGRNSYGQL